MRFEYIYKTPDNFDDLLMVSDENKLIQLSFIHNEIIDQKYVDQVQKLPLPLAKTKTWLDCYFSGDIPDFIPDIAIKKATKFRKEVLEELEKIPYGKTVSYGQIARKIASNRGMENMSAQAVGQAVGWNPICIIIPCHRVIAANGNLRGYHGGICNKKALLDLEKKSIHNKKEVLQ